GVGVARPGPGEGGGGGGPDGDRQKRLVRPVEHPGVDDRAHRVTPAEILSHRLSAHVHARVVRTRGRCHLCAAGRDNRRRKKHKHSQTLHFPPLSPVDALFRRTRNLRRELNKFGAHRSGGASARPLYPTPPPVSGARSRQADAAAALLTPATVAGYLQARGLLPAGSAVEVAELGGGISNVVLGVDSVGL